jgi:UDP-N-acetylmuramoyl-tripeptide--D-alanyl-D-alanine ligase
LVSLCLGKYFDVPTAEACQAIAEYIPNNQRSQVILRGNHKIILDAYNANPDSMKAALQSFQNTAGEYKIAILGDMLELGTKAVALHREIILMAQQSKIDELVLVGPLFQQANTQVSMNQAQAFATREAAAAWLTQHLPQKATLLIKGSRGIALEKILDEIFLLKN